MNICHQDESDNQERVSSFTRIWSKHSNITCYYHESQPEIVIAEKVFASTGRAFKAAAFPCFIAIIAFLIVAFRMYRWRKTSHHYEGRVIQTHQQHQSCPMQQMPPQPTHPPPHMPTGQPYQAIPMAGHPMGAPHMSGQPMAPPHMHGPPMAPPPMHGPPMPMAPMAGPMGYQQGPPMAPPPNYPAPPYNNCAVPPYPTKEGFNPTA